MNLEGMQHALDAAVDGTKEVGEAAHKTLESFHNQYVSKLDPTHGKFGDVATFVAEMTPGVGEYNAIREGDWAKLAITSGTDAAAIGISVATAGVGTGAAIGTKMAVKGATEVGEGVAKKAIKEGAEATVAMAFGKGGRGVVEDAAGSVAIDGSESVIEKATTHAVSEVVEKRGTKTIETPTYDGTAYSCRKVPLEDGHWSDDVGNSLWAPDDDFVPQKFNPNQMTFGEIMKQFRIDGIPFVNREPDFTALSRGTVHIEQFTDKRYKNFNQADTQLASVWGVSPADIERFRKDNGLVWHERCDMGTMDLIPHIVHGNVAHSGGVSEYKRLEGLAK